MSRIPPVRNSPGSGAGKARIAPTVKARKNGHRVSRDRKVDEIRESLKDSAVNPAVHDRVDQRRLGEPDE
jgi:hypothetical protein